MSILKKEVEVGEILAGVDLGGTYIKTALITLSGEIYHKTEVPSDSERGPDTVIENICSSIRTVLKESGKTVKDLKGIGIGSPGPLNTKTGVVLHAVNLPGWINVPLRRRVQDTFGVPTHLENDANAAAFGEYWRGAGRGASIMVAYTLGTGVGGGVVLWGRLLRGTNDCGAELGHVTIIPDGERCSCGNYGCLEAYASASALVRRTRAKLSAGAESILQKWLADGTPLTAKLIDDAHRAGDEFAKNALEESGYYLGLGVANVVATLNPDIVVIGGGMAKAGDVILGAVRREVKKRVFSEAWESLRIVPAQLGNDAGVIGAAGLVLERLKG